MMFAEYEVGGVFIFLPRLNQKRAWSKVETNPANKMKLKGELKTSKSDA